MNRKLSIRNQLAKSVILEGLQLVELISLHRLGDAEKAEQAVINKKLTEISRFRFQIDLHDSITQSQQS